MNEDDMKAIKKAEDLSTSYKIVFFITFGKKDANF